MNPEGWFLDPFGHHEARWFSDGVPTALVRDGGIESQDSPPSTAIEGELQRLPEPTQSVEGALLRADDAEAQAIDPNAYNDAAEESIDSSW